MTQEIERAIKVLEEEYAFALECDATQKRSSAYKFALTVLRAAIDREANEPPKCYECKNEADSWECERCVWGDKTDRYEPKEEPTCTQD